MKLFWVEGVYRAKSKSKALEPFAKAIYAEKAEAALRMAEEMLNGGVWVGEPKVSQRTEEQRMRTLGAPELPGFGAPAPQKASAPKPAAPKPAAPKPAPKKPAPTKPAARKPAAPKPARKHGR